MREIPRKAAAWRQIWSHGGSDRPAASIYDAARLTALPLDAILRTVRAAEGNLICLGSGYATLEALIALNRPDLEVVATEHDARRVRTAQDRFASIPNLSIRHHDATHPLPEHADNVLMSDLLHHLPPGTQLETLRTAVEGTHVHGYVFVKDVDTNSRGKYLFNMFHDAVVAGPPLTYHTSTYYRQEMERLSGSAVEYEDASKGYPYAHYILTAKGTRPR